MRQCGNHPRVTVSPGGSDWANKGAHVYVGGEEVRILPDYKGEVDGRPLRRKGGAADQSDVDAALCALKEDKQLRDNLIGHAESVMHRMNADEWGVGENRAVEMKFLNDALRRI